MERYDKDITSRFEENISNLEEFILMMIKYIEQKATQLEAKKNKVLAKALEEADTKNTATVVKPRNVLIWSGGYFHTWSESV